MSGASKKHCWGRWNPCGTPVLSFEVLLAALQLSGCTRVDFAPNFLGNFLWDLQELGSCHPTAAAWPDPTAWDPQHSAGMGAEG